MTVTWQRSYTVTWQAYRSQIEHSNNNSSCYICTKLTLSNSSYLTFQRCISRSHPSVAVLWAKSLQYVSDFLLQTHKAVCMVTIRHISSHFCNVARCSSHCLHLLRLFLRVSSMVGQTIKAQKLVYSISAFWFDLWHSSSAVYLPLDKIVGT